MSEDRSNLKKKILSVVVSVYNEEQALEECYTEMKRVLDTLSWDHELTEAQMAAWRCLKPWLQRIRR